MRLLALTMAVAVLLSGCDRRTAPYDPNEKVEAPDLSKIFPEGARVVEERERAGSEAAPAASGSGAGGTAAAAADGAPIRGTLELSGDLQGAVPRGAVLFLVARAPSGGPPVAVKRIADPTFPLDYEIGPDDRMIQSVPFAGPLFLTARVDGDGNASTREPGDLAGAANAPVDPGTTGVTIRIDQKLTESARAGGPSRAAAPSPSGGRVAPPASGARAATPVVAGAGAPIRGTIELSGDLQGAVPGGAVLFLVARNGSPGPPVAVKRIPDPTFPMTFEIGPGDRMIQSIPFAGPLSLSARVDQDGNAMSHQPGDLEGSASGVNPGDTGVTIRINQKL